MTALEDQQHIVNLLEDALGRIREAMRIEQRMSHIPHPDPLFKEINGRLEWLLDSERALLKRIQTVGR